jgi:hypothetical protein
MKISEIPVQEFASNDTCFYIEVANRPTVKAVGMQNVFDWIRDEAIKNGLTVKMVDDGIMFISGKEKHEL